jgi:transient receptor potential cation channel subfamily V member 5
LDLLEGVLIDLLKTKWNTFVKAKFYRQFRIFSVYFLISLCAFGFRPKAYTQEDDDGGNNSTLLMNNETTRAPVKSFALNNMTEILCNYTVFNEALSALTNVTNTTTPSGEDEMDNWNSFSECPLLDISSTTLKIKLVAEGALTIFALYYILTAFRELRFLGAQMFFENLVSQQTFVIVNSVVSSISLFSRSRALHRRASCFCSLAGSC